MQLTSTLIAALALTTGTQAFIAELYSDTNCRVPAGSRNVYDNTCAPLGGFQSWKITTRGGNGQYARSYSPNNCFGPVTACRGAGPNGSLNACIPVAGSNALDSSTVGC